MSAESEVFSFLNGLECWGTIAGEGTGSAVRILLGDKVLRERPLTNSALTEEQRLYDSQCDVFVNCSWRLSDNDSFLCSSLSENVLDGQMLRGLARLNQRTVTSVATDPQSLDLTIRFEEGLVLTVFNDVPIEDPDDESYSVRQHKTYYTVKGFELVTE